MNPEDFDRASKFWAEKDRNTEKMPDDQLRQWVDSFLARHNTLALATASTSGVRCTPLEYTWKNGAIVIVSEGGEKFAHLKENPQVGVAIFDPYTGFGALSSVQVSGSARIDRLDVDSIDELAEWVPYPADTFRKLDHPMYLIRIEPARIDVLSSSFKDLDYDARQRLEC
ncbi:MAG: pyridoxamine 5'-phosphate oxidase family protein [Coriobacteriales bacterium]|nr:pyridoxamine 5'-phosphate oxidase family protein [Coriobacteriales bacterium]